MFKMILAKQYLAIAFRLSLVALVLISQSTANLHAQEEGPEPPPGGQGGGGTGESKLFTPMDKTPPRKRQRFEFKKCETVLAILLST